MNNAPNLSLPSIGYVPRSVFDILRLVKTGASVPSPERQATPEEVQEKDFLQRLREAGL